MERCARSPSILEWPVHYVSCLSTLLSVLVGVSLSATNASVWPPIEDAVTPYKFGFHGSPKSHRQIRDCQPVKYGNTTHHSQKAHAWDHPRDGEVPYPISTLRYFFDDLPFGERAPGHITWVNNPARTISVLEPYDAGGCTAKHRATVDVSARQEDCIMAVNAGLFNTRMGDCYGNVVSNGRRVQTSGGIQNAHFGIRADGSMVFGYLSEEDVLQEENPFIQLVGGVGWLLRDGEVYVEESRKAECEETEESGTVDTFFNMLSARVAVGSDEEGRVVIAVIDGQSKVRGLSLSSFASWLLSHGVKNAVNLDGGGSTTFVINGTIANNPSDHCQDSAYRCPRQVSTVLCVHEPRCEPRDCGGHGDCVQGVCRCHGSWTGTACDGLQCGDHNCSGRGTCHGGGCQCDPGYLSPDCSVTCPGGWYGQDCGRPCNCENGGSCDSISGECFCFPGYTGERCQDICPLGFHGRACLEECQCGDGMCPCHHITGLCSLQLNDSYYGGIMKVGQCLARKEIKEQRLVPFIPLREDQLTVALLVTIAIATVSILCNFICLCLRCSCDCTATPCQDDCCGRGYTVRGKHVYRKLDREDCFEEDEL